MLHICDGEFNIPASHAIEVCEAITARGLDSRIQWYAYATVHPFPKALATAMKRAGCVGINFGADSASPAMLKTLKRGYAPSAIRDAVTYCRQEGITVMLDLLLGGPGETPETVRSTIDFVKSLDFDRCGAATGIRLYPHTLLAEQIIAEGMETNANLHGQLTDNNDLLEPVFYISQHLGRDAGALVCDVIGHDERFFPPPRLKDATNYNYNDNQVLQDAIDAGARGAFWDILRQL
jgi:radical SAM superfamily enzyme YgiQ (UPF0313 family)